MKSFLTFASALLLSFTVCHSATAMEYYPVKYLTDMDSHVQFHGEYLYWQVIQDHMQYGASVKGGIQGILSQVTNPFSSITDSGKLIDPQFHWDSGFRVGAGYKTPCSPWDIDLSYVRFYKDQKSHTTMNDHQIIPLAVPASVLFGIINRTPAHFHLAKEALSSWHFKYDTLDLTFGRSARLWNDFVFHPFVGVKAAAIRQRQFIKYDGFKAVPSTGGSPEDVLIFTVKKNEFRAIGPSFGFDNFWEIVPGVSLSSGLTASLLYGKVKIHEFPQARVDENFIKFTIDANKKHRVKPVVDGYAGLDWSSVFCGWGVTLGVAYEVQYWWNQWNAPSSAIGVIFTGGLPSSGDLVLHGMNAHVSVSF